MTSNRLGSGLRTILPMLPARSRPAQAWPPERFDATLGETEKEVADGVIKGKTFQAQQGVRDAIGAQPFAVGEALRADHDRPSATR